MLFLTDWYEGINCSAEVTKNFQLKWNTVTQKLPDDQGTTIYTMV